MGSRVVTGSGPLSGLRVLDLTRVLAGPYATMILGDLGAEVIKVERPGEGDETRGIPPSRNGDSHYFLGVNRNKLGVAIDLKDARARDIVYDLARTADVLVENFRPGVVERLGLDHSTLKAENPRLIYCSITGFGQTGPWARRSAFDIAIQALSGAMSVTGEPDRPPMRLGLPMGDLSGGLFGVIGILAALAERERTGQGQLVDVAMLDGMVSLLGYLAGMYLMTGTDPGPVGSGHHNIVPYGAFEAKDGYIIIATLTESFWPKLCTAIGLSDLIGDGRFDTNAKRVAQRDAIDKLVARAIRRKTVSDWCEVFELADVPHAPVLKISDVMQHPQVLARGMVREVEHPSAGHVRFVGPALHFPSSAGELLAPPPRIGEHSREVLETVLGYPPEKIEALIRDGVVAVTEQ